VRPTQERKIYIIIFSACERASERLFSCFLFSYARNSSARQTPSLTGKHNKHFKTKTHAAAYRDFIFTCVCVEPRDHPVSMRLEIYFFVFLEYTEAFFLDKNTAHMSLFLCVVQEVETFAKRGKIMRNLCCVLRSLALTFLRILYPSTCRSFSHLVRGTRKKNYESAEIYYLAALVLIEPLYNLLLYIAIKLFRNVSPLLYTP
jgi:hypothetical protein